LASTQFPRRFLPPDPRVEEPYRLTPQLALRVAVLGFLALAIFGFLFLRLWALQVLSGDKYVAAASDNRVRTIDVEAPRGPILDRNGHTIVTNTYGFRIELWRSDLPKTWDAERTELKRLSGITGLTTPKILALMKAHGTDPLTPVVLQTGLHRDQVYYLSEHQPEFPGVEVARSYIRKYPYQSLLAQVLGYDGLISPQEWAAVKGEPGYTQNSTVGQTGLEKTYDTYLRGRDGSAQLTVDSLGRPSTSTAKTTVVARPGEALKLTIDIGLQRTAERALQQAVQAGQAIGGESKFSDGGAIAAIDPRDGAVRALASWPTYKPSVWAGRTDPKKLAPLLDPKVAAQDNYPALNRAIAGRYPPGSTFKPITAIAALETGVLSPGEQLPCTPDYTAYGHVFNNWTPLIDTSMDLETAIEQSCDTWFYALGKRFYELPKNRGHPLQAWARRLGIGEKTGVDIAGEDKGLLPTPEWRCKAYGGKPPYTGPTCDTVDRTWKPGYSINLSIGQGDLLVTPLQMARAYAAIANGGKLVTPHIADDVETPSAAGQTSRVLRRFGGQPPVSLNVDPSYLSMVQNGMYLGAHNPNGTSYGVFGDFPIPIAGKTGSAEKTVTIPGYNPQNLIQSWWCGYGPFDSPNLVVCAVVENGGHGGTVAAPAALKVFEKWFGKTATITQHASD
jgi:penicillin-binding protein 2